MTRCEQGGATKGSRVNSIETERLWNLHMFFAPMSKVKWCGAVSNIHPSPVVSCFHPSSECVARGRVPTVRATCETTASQLKKYADVTGRSLRVSRSHRPHNAGEHP